jgi:hypothetical protein
VHVKPAPPVEAHVASATQSSVPATHASITPHVNVPPGHAAPEGAVPAGHVQEYEPGRSLQVPRPQRPGTSVHSL